MSTDDKQSGLSPHLRRRLIARAADRRVLLSVEPDQGLPADLGQVRRLRALARLKALAQAALADGAAAEEVLEAILSGDPDLRPAAAAQLIDGGEELLERVRRRQET